MNDNHIPRSFITKHDHGGFWWRVQGDEKNTPLIANSLQCECAHCGHTWIEPTPIYDIECPTCDYQPVVIVFTAKS